MFYLEKLGFYFTEGEIHSFVNDHKRKVTGHVSIATQSYSDTYFLYKYFRLEVLPSSNKSTQVPPCGSGPCWPSYNWRLYCKRRQQRQQPLWCLQHLWRTSFLRASCWSSFAWRPAGGQVPIHNGRQGAWCINNHHIDIWAILILQVLLWQVDIVIHL